MSELVEFLRARLDEDEAAAKRATPGSDPARVLREVEGGRAIIELQLDRAVSDLPDEVLLHLAAFYSDHADYRQEWKP